LRSLKIGQIAVPLWLLAVLLISLFGSVLGYIVWTLNVEVEVKEPIRLYYYPVQLSLFPGETEDLEIDIENLASVNYSVTLDLRLNDSSYQSSYVTFSDTAYTVVPGEQILMAWVKVAANAPAANVTLTVDLSREAYTPS